MAINGELITGVSDKLKQLSEQAQVHVLTADTFVLAVDRLSDIPGKLTVLPVEGQDEAKIAYVRKLGCERTICVGNGQNDHLMLKEAKIGIAVIGGEGAATKTILASDVVVPDILAVFNLFANTLRLTATLRT